MFHKRLILAKNHLSKSNNFNMFVLEANTLFLLFRTLDSSNPGTSKHPHMSNRIYETFDSEYGIFLIIPNHLYME